ncbi:MAG TPA: response regulator [Polyangiaceae bacterium]|jgi:CheY-like chemotaxis protein|nr:response regulator [Polyangiaceae bacterium]
MVERPLPRVLIVDDQPEIARALSRVFAADAKVTIAQSGKDALAQIETTSFDLVICDVMMPGMTGPELFERVKAIDAKTASAFVFTTGGVDAHHEKELRATGARWLTKPVEIRDLRKLLPPRG